MPDYTENAKLWKGTLNERNWHLGLRSVIDAVDGAAGVGPLCVTPSETPSTTLGIRVAPGRFVRAGGGAIDLYVEATATVTPSATTLVWLTPAGSVGTGAAYPATEHVPLAAVEADATTVLSVTDARIAWAAVTPSPPGSADQAAADPAAIAALAVSDPPTQAQVVAIRDAVAAVATLANALRTALVNDGTIKGSV